MDIKLIVSGIILLPLVARGIFIARQWRQMREVLSNDESDREEHRSLILAFAGFSFTGVVGLVVLGSADAVAVKYAVYCLLGSFVAYFLAFNLEGYKATRWQDSLSTALRDTGTGCLVFALVILVFLKQYDTWFVGITAGIALLGWFADCVIRFVIDWRFLRDRGDNEKQERDI